MVLNRKNYVQINYQTEVLYCGGGQALKQDAQRSGCPIPGSVKGQIRGSSEQPDVVSHIPAFGRGDGTG